MRARPIRRGRKLIQAFHGSIIFYPVLAGVAGVALALALIAVSSRLPPPPAVVEVPAQSAHSFLASVTGAMITATAILFWVRGTLVQLASSHFPSRVLRWYLEDRFQQAVMAVLAGAFTYSATLLLVLPGDADTAAPFLAVTVALLAALAVLLVIVGSIQASVRATHPSEMLAYVVSRTLARVRSVYPEAGSTAHAQDTPPVPEDALEVAATTSGWVRGVDEGALLAALPEGVEAWLVTRPGIFVTQSETLVHVTGVDADDAERVVDDVRATVEIGASRSLDEDVDYGLGEIADVGMSALAPGSGDATTGFECIMHMGVVLREILLRDMLPARVDGEDGRRLYRTLELSHAEYVRRAFDPLRHDGTRYPDVAIAFLSTLAMLVRQVEHAGLRDRMPPLRDQARLVIADVRAVGMRDADLERVLDVARKHGFT